MVLEMKKRAHLLVVDDDPQILDMLTCTLEDEGYTADIAANGSSALTLLTEHNPDLVLLDIKMPDLNGYEVLQLIREKTEIPVIMLTGVLEPVSVYHSVRLGDGG